jgi:hypothetical protein
VTVAPWRRQTARVLPVDGMDSWERATTDKYGWLSPGDLGPDDPPADPELPDLIRVAAASVRERQPWRL